MATSGSEATGGAAGVGAVARGQRMPRPVRLAIVAVATLALASAAYLIAVRGPALLIDLSHMAAGFLCF